MTAYSRFVAASGVTNLADGIATLAWAWAATLLTRDAFLVALVPVALRLPWAILAIPAGVVADRVDRRRLILAMDLLRGAAFTGAALALFAASPLPPAGPGLAMPWLYAGFLLAAAAVGGAEVFRDNAAQTMMPALVPQEALERANGRLWSVELVGNALLGPAIGAVLVGATVALPFAVNAGLYGLAVLLVAGVAGTFRAPATSGSLREGVAEGMRFLWASRFLRSLAAITGVWNLLHQMVVIALVLHVQENLGLSAAVWGLVLAAGAVGGIAGSLCAEAVIRRLGPGNTARWMLATSAPAFAAVALAPGPLSLATVLAVFEGSGLIWNVLSVSWRQRRIPDALLGRVNSLYRLLAWGMMPVGLLLSGLITGAAEASLTRSTALALPFWVAAAGALVLTLAAWGPLGRGFQSSD